MADNFVNSSKFYLTSRAGEQLVTTTTSVQHETEQAVKPAFSSYVSTAAQNHVTNPNQNLAIRNNALAGISLGKGSAVNQFNSYMKRVQLDEKLNQNKQ